jgi:hypothetical protein
MRSDPSIVPAGPATQVPDQTSVPSEVDLVPLQKKCLSFVDILRIKTVNLTQVKLVI